MNRTVHRLVGHWKSTGLAFAECGTVFTPAFYGDEIPAGTPRCQECFPPRPERVIAA